MPKYGAFALCFDISTRLYSKSRLRSAAQAVKHRRQFNNILLLQKGKGSDKRTCRTDKIAVGQNQKQIRAAAIIALS